MKGKISLLLFVFIGLFAVPSFANADNLNQQETFHVDSSYHAEGKEQITATLRSVGNRLYFYIDDSWWNSISQSKKNEIFSQIQSLDRAFDREIYPTLTGIFGFENRPGIDGEERLTILIHPMKNNAGGYFNTGDGVSRFESSQSNEREMFYLNADRMEDPFVKSFVAHEFVHLIYYNQKQLKYGSFDDVWIQEGIAEMAPRLVGYTDDSDYLQNRLNQFVANSRDALGEWKNLSGDYAVVNLFFQYLLDHYETEVLVDIIQTDETGIFAINEALSKNGHKKTFQEVFTDWVIALYLNDCTYGPYYCYKRAELQDLRVVPYVNYLPQSSSTELSVTNQTKDWAGNWHKIVGSKGTLEIVFDGNPSSKFVVPYVLEKEDGSYEVDFFTLSQEQKGEVQIPNFGEDVASVVIMPTAQGKLSNFGKSDQAYFFVWTSSVSDTIVEPTPSIPTTGASVEELLAQIQALQARIVQLQAQLAVINGEEGVLSEEVICTRFDRNLSFGMSNDEVRCLQQMLAQLPGVYPEGLVTGNFLSLTERAVIRFQNEYASEVLHPLGLEEGTGYVGTRTRMKLNELLSTIDN